MSEDITGEIQEEQDVQDSSPVSEEMVDAGSEEGQPQKPELTDKERALIKARDDKARKAREAEDRAIRAEERARMLEEQLKPKHEEPEEEFDEFTPLTYGDLKKMREKEERQRQAEQRKRQEQDFQAKLVSSANKAKKAYKDSDFTYEDALQYAVDNFSENKIRAISMMDDPGQELYDAVLYATGRHKEKAVQEAAKTIQNNLNQAGTLSSKGGANKILDTIKKMDEMSGPDFIAQMDEIIKSKQ
jgi:hypothetical protein